MKPSTNPMFHDPKNDSTHGASFAKGCLIALGIEAVIILTVLGFCKYKGYL